MQARWYKLENGDALLFRGSKGQRSMHIVFVKQGAASVRVRTFEALAKLLTASDVASGAESDDEDVGVDVFGVGDEANLGGSLAQFMGISDRMLDLD